MATSIPSLTDITNRVYNKLIAETGITANLDSSNIGVLIKVITAEVYNIWQELDRASSQSDITTATGTSLDKIGYDFGVPRKQSSPASTSGLTRSVRFTNLGSLSVTLPSGVRVYKSSTPQLAFFTTEGATIAAGISTDVHVTASDSGEIFNVGIGELNSHNMPNTSLSVTNILPISNGSSVESDASYRQRILQDFRRRDSLNVSNLDSLLRSVPGVKDVFILEMYRGAGTFDAIIIPYNQSSAAQVVAECRTLLGQAVPVGISGLVRSPRYRQLDVQITLRLAPDSAGRADLIRAQIRAQIQATIDNLPVEDGSGVGSFNSSHIGAIADQADNAILDVVTSLGLDGSPLFSSGVITLSPGERLVLRALSVV